MIAILKNSLIIFILIIGFEIYSNSHSDDEFYKYKKDWESIGGPEVKINISFYEDKKESNIIGYCQFNKYIDNFIKINSNKWKYLNNTQKRITIFHELGHCILKRDHLDSIYGGIPLSIMSSYLFDYRIYERFQKEYDEELISQNSDHLKVEIDKILQKNIPNIDNEFKMEKLRW